MEVRAFDLEMLPLDFLQFAHHCEVLCDGRQLPRRQDFSLADVTWLEDRIYEVDVLGSYPDYYFRRVGLFWQSVYGEDFGGHWLSEIELRTDKFDTIRAQYDWVVNGRAPLINHSRLIWPNEVELELDRLMIPFSLDGETVSQIVVAAHFEANLDELLSHRPAGLPQLVIEEMPHFVLPLAM